MPKHGSPDVLHDRGVHSVIFIIKGMAEPSCCHLMPMRTVNPRLSPTTTCLALRAPARPA